MLNQMIFGVCREIPMKERKKLVTEETKINVDEEVFNIKAKELICELFVDYVNSSHQSTVIELKNKSNPQFRE
jgi:hypothetical protein